MGVLVVDKVIYYLQVVVVSVRGVLFAQIVLNHEALLIFGAVNSRTLVGL